MNHNILKTGPFQGQSIPESIISEFVEVSSRNYSIETLALLIGYCDGNDIIPTELVFPKQNGTATKVDDLGKDYFIKLDIKILCICDRKSTAFIDSFQNKTCFDQEFCCICFQIIYNEKPLCL